MFCVEYANFNSQAAFNAAKDANGCAQGGLGNGPTTLAYAQWGSYNDYRPFIPCGYTDSLNNMSGEIIYAIPNEDGSIFANIYANRYRGIENPFGHLHKIRDGCGAILKSDAEGGSSGFYVCGDPAQFTSSGTENYELRGDLVRAEGFVT